MHWGFSFINMIWHPAMFSVSNMPCSQERQKGRLGLLIMVFKDHTMQTCLTSSNYFCLYEQRQCTGDFVDPSSESFISGRFRFKVCLVLVAWLCLSADWLLKYMAIQIH